MTLSAFVGWLLNNPETGWFVVILYLVWEIRGPRGAIHDLRIQMKKIGTITRALARVHDDIATEDVDDYLNGHKEPHDFISDEEQAKHDEERRDDADEFVRKGDD